jgi:hypothetical protein
LAVLQQLGKIGHLQGILSKLDETIIAQPHSTPSLAFLRRLAEDCDLDGYRAAIEIMMRHAS